MNLGESIRSGVKWLMFGNIGMRFIEFAFGVVLARLLVPADFGIIVTISVFTGFVGMVMSGGMGQSLIRAKSVNGHDFSAVFTMQLALGIATYLGFFIAAPWIARFFENSLYADLLRISALSFLLRPFAFMRTAWLNREMDFKRRSVIDVATTGLTSIASVAMAWAGMGVWSLTLSGLIGSLSRNILLARFIPLDLRLNLDFSIMRKHSGYGFKITANDFLSYLTRESKNLLLSKLAGPAFLGLFNKSESLSRLPNQMFMSSTMQPLFRAMSKVQDDLDQTKYMFYRAISLLTVYATPLYVGLWWVAEPFIQVVYGEKWLAAAEPMRILVMSGMFLNILFPCATLLDAQNRLRQEMIALVVQMAVTLIACVVGLQWGLTGVAWAITLTNAFSAVYYYLLVRQTIRTRYMDLLQALAPGLLLGSLLFAALGTVHYSFPGLNDSRPAMYLSLMILAGGLTYVFSFLYIPIASISGEARRWRDKIGYGLKRISRTTE